MELKITFPHMGEIWIPIKSMLEGLGLKVVIPPPITKRTVDLGVRYSPEFACFPLKITLGNFIEGIERGADTILMAGGVGPCRFGYYAQVQREILNDLGYKFNMICIDPPQGNWQKFLDSIRPLGNGNDWRALWKMWKIVWQKFKAIDILHRKLMKVRCCEKVPGESTREYERLLKEVEEASTPEEVREVVARGERLLESLRKPVTEPPLRIGIVGEIYMMLEPFANLEIERSLGEMGVEVERSIYLTNWIRDHLFLDPRRFWIRRRFKKAAEPYLSHFVGGHGWESVGETIIYSRRGFDGVVHILPFTCTPEIVAQSILPQVSKDYRIPVISFTLDEHSSRTGFQTRLEAFVDMLKQNRQREKAYT